VGIGLEVAKVEESDGDEEEKVDLEWECPEKIINHCQTRSDGASTM